MQGFKYFYIIVYCDYISLHIDCIAVIIPKILPKARFKRPTFHEANILQMTSGFTHDKYGF